MTQDNEEFDALLRDFRNLTPEQRGLLTRHVIGRARAYRVQAIRDLFARMAAWFRRRIAVRQLRALDDRMLKDLGINRGDIENVVCGPDRLRSLRSNKRTAPPVPDCGLSHGAGRAA